MYSSAKSKITDNTFTLHNYTCEWNDIEKIIIKKSEIGNPYLILYFKDNSPPRGFDITYVDTTNLLHDLSKIADIWGIFLKIDDRVRPVLERKPPGPFSLFEPPKKDFQEPEEELAHEKTEKKSESLNISLTSKQKKAIMIVLAVVFVVWLFIIFDFLLGIYILIILFVHEGGHFIVLKIFHLETSSIIFIPFVGAGIIPKKGFTSPEVETTVALAGPLAGLSLNIVGLVLYDNWAFFAQRGYYPVVTMVFKFLMYCLPLNFFINIANLLPISPLDGGRIVKSALLRGKISFAFLLILSIIIGVWCAIELRSIIIAIIVLLGIGTLVQHYRSITSQEMNPPSWKMTILILGSWIFIIFLYWLTLPSISKELLIDPFSPF
jgi:Zn-dependent protease